MTNPCYFVKKGIYHGLKNHAQFLSDRMLDFGCGNKSYSYLFSVKEHIGLEVFHAGHDHADEPIDVFYNGKTIPFRAECFDSVLCAEVFEYLFDCEKSLSEIRRVLKIGGYLLLTTPFFWEEHEQPYDFGRYTEFGLRDILARHHFEILRYEKYGNFIEVIAQLWNLYLFKKLFRRFAFLRFVIIPFLIVPTNLLGTFFSILLPKNFDVFHHSVIVAPKTEPSA
ncbi:MAG: class I SAM-dependent methyltransferase [Methanoregula sp.]